MKYVSAWMHGGAGTFAFAGLFLLSPTEMVLLEKVPLERVFWNVSFGELSFWSGPFGAVLLNF